MDRVKISYAVDLHNVPSTANELLEQAVSWLSQVTEELQGLNLVDESLPSITQKIHKVRTQLAKVDQRVDDCYAITAGYHEAMSPDRPPPDHRLPDEQGIETGDISDKIRELQDAIATGIDFPGNGVLNDEE